MALLLNNIRRYYEEAEQEGSRLEFKRGAALGRELQQRTELVKDVTGFANADGGRIIYGLDEQEQGGVKIATRLSPLNDVKVTREAITQVLRANTGPSLSGFEISEVLVPDTEGGGRVVVVDIEPASTAHQNSFDRKYYLRVGPTTEAMFDFQVRDVMNRRSWPVIDVNIRRVRVQTGDPSEWILLPRIRNLGVVSLDRWTLEIEVPCDAIAQGTVDNDFAQFPRSDVVRTVFRHEHGVDFWRFQYVAPREPTYGRLPSHLHPGQEFEVNNGGGMPHIRITVDRRAWQRMSTIAAPIFWRIYMPNARPLTGEIRFAEWCDF